MSQARKNNDLSTVPPASFSASQAPTQHFLDRVIGTDPLSALEDKSSDTLDFLRQSNQDANSFINKPLQDTLFTEIRHRTPLDHDSYPTDLEQFRYFVRQRENLDYPQFWRCLLTTAHRKNPELTTSATCYLDTHQLAKGYDYFDLGDLALSPDEMQLALTTDTEGDEIYRLSLIDLSSGKLKHFDDLPELASDLLWSEDPDILLCCPLDDTQRPWQVMALNIRTGQHQILFQEADPRYWVGCSKSRDRQSLFIESLSKQSTAY